MSALRFFLFGFPRFEREGVQLPLARRRGLALAAYLAVNDGPQSRDLLTTLIWPEFDTARGRRNLRRELSLLRSEVAPELIEADRSRVAFGNQLDITVDLHEFIEATEGLDPEDVDAARSLLPVAVERLKGAVELHHLRFLESFSLPDSPDFDDWQYLQAEELERRLATALQVLIQYSRTHKLSEQSLAYGQRWLDLDRLNEAAHRSLIEDFARAGQWAAAQRQLDRCVQLLADELGLEPENETLDLARQVRDRRLDSHGARQTVAPQRAGDGQRTRERLPTVPGRLVGRDRELADLTALLGDEATRLVTLVGPGGIGKTRLALGVAKQLADLSEDAATPVFRDGVALIELAPLDHPDQLMPALAGVLGIERRLGSRGAEDLMIDLVNALRGQQLLVVLDNFEHIIAAAEPLADLLRETAEVTFLITSRERLDLREEHVYRVDGLELSEPPGSEDQRAEQLEPPPAVDLFVQRARMADHDFELDAGNSAAVGRICRLLDGMPLAIELAAARLDLFSTAELADEIERDISILEARARDVPARQRSMQVVFDSSWEQLTVEEQAALVQLSVFRGGFSREAAQLVAGATVPILERLTARSMIRFDRLRFRFQIHELMRQYLSAKLADVPELARAAASQHASYYCRWIAARASGLKEQHQSAALAEIRREFENVRVAWNQAVAAQAADQVDMAAEGLALFLELEGRVLDGRMMTDEAVSTFRPRATGMDSGEASHLAYARTLAWRSAFDRALGHTDAAFRGVQEILKLTEELPGAEAIRAFALLQTGTGRFTTAATESDEDYIESARLFRIAGDRWGEGLALAEVGRVAWSDGELDEAERRYAQSLSIFRDLGNQREMANVLGMLSQVARYQAQAETAVQRAEEMLALTRESGSWLALASALGSLGGSLYFTGEFDEAARLLEEADRYYQEFGTLTDRASTLMRWGRVEGVRGNLDAAYDYLTQSRDIYAGIDLHGSVAYIDADLADMELSRGRTGPAMERMEDHLKLIEGTDRPFELSRVLATLAYIDFARGDHERAVARAREALIWVLESGGGMALIEIVANVVPIATAVVGPERVQGVWIFLATYPWVGESVFYRKLIGADSQYLQPADPPLDELDPQDAARLLLALLSENAGD
jgi:predicted ATPase/DNA-binding SARP family transcriptional activator